jgi:hypothetical protein
MLKSTSSNHGQPTEEKAQGYSHAQWDNNTTISVDHAAWQMKDDFYSLKLCSVKKRLLGYSWWILVRNFDRHEFGLSAIQKFIL